MAKIKDAKSFLVSKTLWGVLLSGLGAIGIATPTGFDTDIVNIIDHGFQFGGLVLAAYGRFKAETPLKIK